MKSLFSRFAGTFFGRRLDLRVRLFNVLAIAGTAVSTFFAVFAVFTGRPLNAAIASGGAVLAFLLLYYSYRSGHYQRCYMITVTGVFLVMFPAMFFTWGGYKSGLPAFFVFAVLFTVFMLQGRRALVMSIVELCVYVALCVVAYLHPELVHPYSTELEAMLGITSSFIIVCVALGITMRAHFNLYDAQQRELEAARQRLAEENAALEEISRVKTEFLGNVSHELKTPLTVVSGYAQTARQQILNQSRSDEGDAAAAKMKLISSEAERLALMVEQVLDVTRIEEGRMAMDLRPCHVDEAIFGAVDTHFPILNKNANKLDIRIDDNLPEIMADPARIQQVVVNLIANAIRFTENGQITVSASAAGPFVSVGVADTGAGIAPERLPYIFERYNNNQKSGGGNDTGTGLGLYICKFIVEEHGGAISVQSVPGKGTTVAFTLPAVNT